MIKELKDIILHEAGGFLNQTNVFFAETFSIYDNVAFHEFVVSPLECVTIGFSHRANSTESSIFLISRKISFIQKNIESLVSGGHGVQKEKPINPVVFKIDFKKKRWLKIKPDYGDYVDGTLLKGNFKRVFDIVISATHRLHEKTRILQPGTMEMSMSY